MKWLSVFLSCILIGAMIFGSGCTKAESPAEIRATHSQPAPVSLLSSYALTAADAPVNYTLTESRAKTSDEVGSLAKTLGWAGGYVVNYSGIPDNRMGPTTITQTITSYPAAHMPEILELTDKNDRSDKELIITALPSPGLGQDSRAFSGKAISQIVMREKTDDPLDSGTLQGSFKQDIVEIIFAKGSTIEVLRMSGPHADFAILTSLAEKAWAKLP
jgi:hypothetical protein